MSSYNSYDGVPVVADSFLLTDILRDEWGYKYFVTSDAGGTARLDSAFHVCPYKNDQCITLKVNDMTRWLVFYLLNLYLGSSRRQ